GGGDPTNAFALGQGGVLLHYDGTTWSPLSSGTANDLFGAAGASGDLWAVGQSGTIVLSSDGGATWTQQTSPTTQTLQSADGCSTTDLFAVGGTATIIDWNGSRWSAMVRVSTMSL